MKMPREIKFEHCANPDGIEKGIFWVSPTTGFGKVLDGCHSGGFRLLIPLLLVQLTEIQVQNACGDVTPSTSFLLSQSEPQYCYGARILLNRRRRPYTT